MGINVFQVGNLNINVAHTNNPALPNEGQYASEFPINLDNINANASRYVKIMGVWPNVANTVVLSGQQADSYGQPSGANNNSNQANPIRPNGGYYVRGLWFSNTATAPNPNRNGYIGSYVGGIQWQTSLDYTHDTNPGPPGGVDYEPIYSHGTQAPNGGVWPQPANVPNQWRDQSNTPSDGTDAIVNSGSAYTRTPYMPPSTFLLTIDSAGSNTLGSGLVSFHFENRPTLRAGGYNDPNAFVSGGGSLASSAVLGGTPGPYSSDPLQEESITQPTLNFYEYYQATGSRPLNSRGLSLHMAKVFDNGYGAYGYPYEEDGITTCPDVRGSGDSTHDIPVNTQSEYLWQRDHGLYVTAWSITSNVASFTATISAANAAFYTVGANVLLQGFTAGLGFNNQYVTIASLVGSGPTYTGFTANFVNSNGSGSETTATTVITPDFRVHQPATFIINEEYYGFVSDTKCTIWSNKASMIPLVFFDLKAIWTGSTAPRIAGVTTIPVYSGQALTYQVFFLSEDGKLARYDFTQTNGVLELAGSGSFSFAANAPAVLAAGEAYGAMHAQALTAPITATSITSNVLTVTAMNNFKAGDVVNITGTAESFLNFTTVTVLSGGLSGTQFTANFTHADFTNASDTGSAVGYSIWALYGTMTADPRTAQLGLAHTANINLYRYSPGLGTWGSIVSSGLTGRHNGRSLQEMTIKRDGRVYILCELVTSSAGFNVANAGGSVTTYSGNSGNPQIYWQVMVYDTITAAWNTSAITGLTAAATITASSQSSGTLNITANNTFSVGQWVNLSGMAEASLNGLAVQIQTLIGGGPTFTGFTANVTQAAFNIPNYSNGADTGSVTSQLQYGNTQGAGINQAPNISFYWFYDINASTTDVAPNKLLVQGNWSGNNLYVLDTTSAPALTNSNIAYLPSATAFPGDAQIPSQTNPWTDPVSFIHNRDYANGGGDRTSVFLHQIEFNHKGDPLGGNIALYYAPPSYNWATPSAFPFWNSNTYAGTAQIGSYNKDAWSPIYLGPQQGNASGRTTWLFPTMMMDNYLHFVRPSNEEDGIPGNATYGRAISQTITYLPTYWKYVGGNWVLADNWADANTNPRVVSGANVNIPLPYGLQVQFGPASGTSYTLAEFHTFNLCWGNTKYTRKGRFSWAMFAGQTFVNNETRTMAAENAMAINFIDTDLSSVTITGTPTSITPSTAAVTSPNLGWNTQAIWPKIDGSNNPYDATTPFQMTLTCQDFDHSTFVNPAAVNPLNVTTATWSWVVGANTYVATGSGEQGSFPAYQAFQGNPQQYWQSTSQNTGFIGIDLGSGNPQTVLSYGFRPVYSGSDTIFGTPTNWTLQGSNTGAFLGEQVIVDTRGPISTFSRGVAYNCNGTTGSFRYYRINVTSNQNGSFIEMSMIRLSTAVLQTTLNFTDLVFNAYGSQNTGYLYDWQRNWNYARGLTFEVSTNNGGSYTPITPLWRAHQGSIYSFARQTGITNIRITAQHGYNYLLNTNSGNQPNVTGFGPFYLLDYGSQATLNSARLGVTGFPGTSVACSFDPQSLGVAVDVASLSIDSGSPNLFATYSYFQDGAVFGFFDFFAVPTGFYKMHPFFGFVLFPGAGPDGSVSTQSGTSLALEYQWGRRV